LRLLAYFLLSLAVLVGFIYFERDWLFSLNMGTQQAAFWDVTFKGIGGIVAVAGAALALSKYFDERTKANQAALIEAQKPFYTKRQEVYFELVSATSTIGNRDKSEESRKEAERQFWWLFWGVLPMVADEQVGSAVNAFSVALDEHRDDGILLRNTSMDLATACRKSLGFIEH
jgi:hypothetical protein